MQNYNLIQKTLHDLCFNLKIINKSLYELEKLLYLKKNELQNIIEKKHVFISGLARSGTTSILNYIFSNQEYASLTYKNMPFIFSINLNTKLFSQKKFEPKIRAHKDRIYYSLESPEALDEPFMNSFKDDNLSSELVNYVSLILNFYNKEKYLSKNNSNYKRINFLKKCFPNSKILIPFRDPIQQSFSLLNQHINFSKLHESDNFTLKYMNYLKHNEFGKNHKAWFEPKLYFDTFELNYWIEQWIKFYEYILNLYQINKNNIKLICYEKLNDETYLNEINNFLDIRHIKLNKFDISKRSISAKFDHDLVSSAVDLYKKLNMF